jgi:hypothetical protein
LSSKSKTNFNHESKSIRQTSLRDLPHREAQERGPRDLQEHAPQAAARLKAIYDLRLPTDDLRAAPVKVEFANHRLKSKS